MLSRIISGKDLARFESAVFLPTAVASQPSRQPQDPEPPADHADELLALREQIRQSHAALEAAKHNSFEAGFREGEQQTRRETLPVIERIHAAVAEVTGLRSEMRQRAEKDVVQLALLIAKRILHRELNVDANALTALARVVFERLARAESYRITVHPAFAEALRSSLPAGHSGRVHIEPDPTAAAGTLIIRSEEGVIDASVDSQLDEITRGLSDRLSHSPVSK